jgi:NAD(P)-dependent dehydrogenase (short-subunit alcohol dehydrogenase family)
MTDASLTGRTVLVTGGSMGIGRACAEAALDAGARVVIAARGQAALDEAAARLGAAHGAERVATQRCDIANEGDVAALLEFVVMRFGGLHGVVHAAAVMGPIGRVIDVDAQEWWDAARTDLFGTFLIAKAGARSMMQSGGGRIVLLSGGGATTPFPNYSAYGCSKAAVVRLVETMALELEGTGIEINALAPGFVATRIHEATLQAGERAGAEYVRRTREQLAEGGVPATLAASAAVFLLSDASAGITGRLLAAPWDDWSLWPARSAEIAASDVFTLRRILPRDRGMAWQ